MTLLRSAVFVFIVSFVALFANAQNGKPSATLPDVFHQPVFVTQSFNPLLLSASQRISGEHGIVFDARAGYSSNSIDAGLVNALYNSEFIQKVTLDRNYSRRLNNNITANISLTAGAAWGSDSSLYVHALYLRQRYDVYLKMSQGLTGVLFYGNAPYENDTISINGEGKFLGFRQLQYVISTRAKERFVLSGSASVLQGLRVNEGRYDGSLYTATMGEYLDLDYDFNFQTFSSGNKIASTRSMGIAFGAGLLYNSDNDRHHAAIGLMETGWFFSGTDARYYKADSSVMFEGFKLSNVFDLNDSTFVNFGDSVAEQLSVKRGNAANTISLPSRFYAQYLYRLRNGFDISVGVEWQPEMERLVHTSIHAGRWIGKSLYAAAQLNTSAFRELNGGVTLIFNLQLIRQPRPVYVQTLFQTRFANAFVVPTASRGFDAALGVRLSF